MQGSKLYVGNLNYAVTKEDLTTLFAAYGEVKEVTVIESKGFAFVEMTKQVDAEKARTELSGTDFKGRPLKVDEAKPPENRRSGGGGYRSGGDRSYGGGGGGGGGGRRF